MESQQTDNILYTNEPLSHLPLERLKHVDKPTNIITDAVQRIDMRDTAYGLAARGEYGAVVQKGVQQSLPGKYPLSAAQKAVIDHIALIQSNATAAKIAPIPQDPAVLTRHIKSVGYFMKADLMGACKVPQSAYYSHDKQGKPIDGRYENAIVIVMRKEWNAMRASKGSDWMGDPLSFQAYAHLGLVAETIADYVRRLGWDATPQYGPSFINKYVVLLPPLLIAAGIGEVSRAGIILNPFLGLAYKAAAVLTDMPIIPDKPIDFGLQNFCRHCKICAENCPSNAISAGGKVMYNGYETWKLNTQRCASFNFTNKKGTMCNRCVKSCPWSNPTTLPHNLIRAMVMRSNLTHAIAIRAAHSLRPGNDHPEAKWWFDLEYVGDEIKNRT
jgi:reductive dehalogenase